MQRLWTIVLRTGNMYRVPVVGRDAAVKRACELLDQGVPVSHICPIAIEHETDVIQAGEIRGLAAELKIMPAAPSVAAAEPAATSPSYRVYFRGPADIMGRDDFAACNDEDALVIAQILFDACSDLCSSFELWQGGRRVLVPSNPPPIDADDAHDMTQAIVIEREEAILRSRFAIAESKRLLARVDQAYRSRVLPSA